jgi:hypothetical protein
LRYAFRPSTIWKIDMEKPNARGPTPSRKAHVALREKLNRKSKLPPLPVEPLAKHSVLPAARPR